jgi:hypothetical protein
LIHIFDCSNATFNESPVVCHDNNDPEIGKGPKVNGIFDIPLHFQPPHPPGLRAGEIIYATDGCFDPTAIAPSPDVIVSRPAPVPVVSAQGIVAVVMMLSLVGLLGLRRLRTITCRSKSRSCQ